MIKDISFFDHVSHFFGILRHKFWVFWYLLKFCSALIRRGIIHDMSKFQSDEFIPLSAHWKLVKKMQFGTKTYWELQEKFKWPKYLHWERNRHHIEHFSIGINGMNMIDLIEMLADWAAAARRCKSNVGKSIRINKDRYKYSNVTASRFEDICREAKLIQ